MGLETYANPFQVSPVHAYGIPYACTGDAWKGFGYVSSPISSACQSLFAMRGASPVGSYANALGTTAPRGDDILAQLFAKTYDRRVLQSQNAPPTTNPQVFGSLDGVDSSHDLSIAANLRAPQIFSLNPRTCQAPVNGRNCSLGEENNLTVNGRNATMSNYDRSADDSPDEDRDQSGFPDPIIGLVSLPVRLQFFAAADDNKMPIRQVRIDWGDGRLIVNEDQKGLYKNRKPYCSPADSGTRVAVGLCGTAPNQLSSMTCKTHDDCPWARPNSNDPVYRCYGATSNVDQNASTDYQFARFGNASRACVQRPFTFIKDYTCSLVDVNAQARPTWVVPVRDLENPDAQTILRGQYGLNDNSLVCVFRPRVQVKDNWGWCNGVDANGNPLPQGLYDYSYTPTSFGLDECATGSNSAWTSYRGQVIVIPTR